MGTFLLQPEGAGFRSSSPNNLIASDDEWTAPIAAEVGPDGFVWVLDWYNYIVQHNPTPRGFENGIGNAYETDLRDKTHGRIYRVVYAAAVNDSAASPNGIPHLSVNAPQPCLAALRHPTMLVRLHAQRLLVERRQTDIVDQLLAYLRDPNVDEIGINVGAIDALGTLHGLRVWEGPAADDTPPKSATALTGEVARLAWQHASPGVRRLALQVLPKTNELAEEMLRHSLSQDPHPQVRLAWLLAVADAPATDALGAAMARVLADASCLRDSILRDAVTDAAAVQCAGVLTQLASDPAISIPTEGLEVLARVAEHVRAVGPVAAT